MSGRASHKISIGHVLKENGTLGHEVCLDLHELTQTRLLVQGGSGSGKTHTLVRIVEQFYGKVQIVVLDREGDFVAMREKYPDFVIAGRGRDIPADPAAAALMAQKALEHQFPLIVDMFEMEDKAREEFTDRFLQAMLDAPERLWHPVLILIDEADELAPEKSAGVALSTKRVAGMAKRGRKRGYAVLIGTQRISDVNKSVLSQCRNKMIGYADLDIDLKRSARAIGLRGEDGEDAIEALERGQFFMRGPAIGRQTIKVKVGPIKTNIERTTKKGMPRHAPPPSSKLRKLLAAELTDLAAQAKEDLRDREQLRARVRELEAKLKKAPQAAPPAPAAKSPSKTELAAARAEGRTEGLQAAREAIQVARDLEERVRVYRRVISTAYPIANRLNHVLESTGITSDPPKVPRLLGATKAHSESEVYSKSPALHALEQLKKARAPLPPRVLHAEPTQVSIGGEKKLGKCHLAILKFLVNRPDQTFNRAQVAGWIGYSVKSSMFDKALSTLRSAGLIHGPGDALKIHDVIQAREILGPAAEEPDRPYADLWREKLGKCDLAIFDALSARPDEAVPKQELAEQIGYSSKSSMYDKALSSLASKKLIKRVHGGVQINEELLNL